MDLWVELVLDISGIILKCCPSAFMSILGHGIYLNPGSQKHAWTYPTPPGPRIGFLEKDDTVHAYK